MLYSQSPHSVNFSTLRAESSVIHPNLIISHSHSIIQYNMQMRRNNGTLMLIMYIRIIKLDRSGGGELNCHKMLSRFFN